jgi:hypothetical protein
MEVDKIPSQLPILNEEKITMYSHTKQHAPYVRHQQLSLTEQPP